MHKITEAEALKVARVSKIAVHAGEAAGLAKHLDDVLTYSRRVNQVAIDISEPSNKNVNVFRDDVVVKSDADSLLAQAPVSEEHFFVVPAIIDSKEHGR